ncbi:MAG: HAD family hydrolase [Armatimonadota bacterium]
MSYKAVIFDLHGTLIPWCPDGFRRMISDVAAVVGADDMDFARAMGELVHKSMTGRFITMTDEIRYVCESIGVNPDKSAINKAEQLWMDFHWQGYENPYPDAVTVLKQLKAHDVKTGLITNCGMDAPNLWPRSLFAPFVYIALFSAVEGIIKPDIKIYARACEQLGVSASDCVFVDDKVSFLDGATEVGMHPILIRHAGNKVGLSGIDGWSGSRISGLGEVLHYLNLSET